MHQFLGLYLRVKSCSWLFYYYTAIEPTESLSFPLEVNWFTGSTSQDNCFNQSYLDSCFWCLSLQCINDSLWSIYLKSIPFLWFSKSDWFFKSDQLYLNSLFSSQESCQSHLWLIHTKSCLFKVDKLIMTPSQAAFLSWTKTRCFLQLQLPLVAHLGLWPLALGMWQTWWRLR